MSTVSLSQIDKIGIFLREIINVFRIQCVNVHREFFSSCAVFSRIFDWNVIILDNGNKNHKSSN